MPLCWAAVVYSGWAPLLRMMMTGVAVSAADTADFGSGVDLTRRDSTADAVELAVSVYSAVWVSFVDYWC